MSCFVDRLHGTRMAPRAAAAAKPKADFGGVSLGAERVSSGVGALSLSLSSLYAYV